MNIGQGNTIRRTAPAKINLYLHITGRRQDGYHLLDSLIVFTGLADELEISPGRELSLSVEGEFAGKVGPDDENLVMRAVRALSQRANVDRGVTVRLIKNIPAAAGLGGGSADAAATLLALTRLWHIDSAGLDLPDIGLGLGADIPVCLTGRASFVSGIGEVITPAPALPEAGILLINPGVALSTPQVFARRRGGFSASETFFEAPANARELAVLLADRRNDLTEAAIALSPVIGDVLAQLEALPDCHLARMSGSGATCFGLFDDEAAAARAADAIARDDWWIKPTKIQC